MGLLHSYTHSSKRKNKKKTKFNIKKVQTVTKYKTHVRKPELYNLDIEIMKYLLLRVEEMKGRRNLEKLAIKGGAR